MTNIASHTSGNNTQRPTHQFTLGGVEYQARLPKIAHWQSINAQLSVLPKSADGSPVLDMTAYTLLDSMFLAMVGKTTYVEIESRLQDAEEDVDLPDKYVACNELMRHFTPLMRQQFAALNLKMSTAATPAAPAPAKAKTAAPAKAAAPAKKAAKTPAKRTTKAAR